MCKDNILPLTDKIKTKSITVITYVYFFFYVCALEFAVTLETVLAGHENWVYGIHWQPPCVKGIPKCFH